MWLIVFERLTIEFVRDILYFPVWWYSAGVLRAGRSCVDGFIMGNQMIAPGLWLRNLLIPMFGQTDWQGRLVSFFIRLISVVVRTILLGIWVALTLALFALWWIAPAAVIFFLVRSWR